jgi:type I restriction enzyme S subunit
MNAPWPIKRLGDLSDLITKGTTPTSIGHAFVPKGINFLKVESISENGQFIEGKLGHITQGCHDVLRRSQLKSEDILFSIAGALGRTAFVTKDILPANTNQALAIIRLKKSNEVLPNFILKVLETGFVLEQIEKFKGGVAQQNLSLAQVREFKIPLPPLPEQQRLVAILDEAFDGIATVKTKAEKNLQNARALFESHLQSVFTQRGEGWVHSTIGDQMMLQRGFDITKNQQNQGKVPVVSSGGIKSFHDKAMATAPGVVIGRKGTLGKVFYLENDYWPHDTTLWIKDFKGNVPRFVYYFFTGLDVKHLDSGTANPALNRNMVHPIEVDWPPLPRQKTIVSILDALKEETQRLESIYQQKLAALNELKKSLLHQAFSGQL